MGIKENCEKGKRFVMSRIQGTYKGSQKKMLYGKKGVTEKENEKEYKTNKVQT